MCWRRQGVGPIASTSWGLGECGRFGFNVLTIRRYCAIKVLGPVGPGATAIGEVAPLLNAVDPFLRDALQVEQGALLLELGRREDATDCLRPVIAHGERNVAGAGVVLARLELEWGGAEAERWLHEAITQLGEERESPLSAMVEIELAHSALAFMATAGTTNRELEKLMQLDAVLSP